MSDNQFPFHLPEGPVIQVNLDTLYTSKLASMAPWSTNIISTASSTDT